MHIYAKSTVIEKLSIINIKAIYINYNIHTIKNFR